ncbi:hypothetical protein C1645_840405 [Glomus cerebriforme]|uniref:Uncharacterized protein n=1 Tax=Glomus cerebriforme TaxID=658196 RepID=A0A397RZG2_9GLOM|nr:hypothetical protein C1645_840405 [Glomus cerebriforme]
MKRILIKRGDRNLSSKQLSIKTVIYSLIPIEYPPTSEEGVAIIYHVEGWENKEAVFANIQYPLGKPSDQNNVNCPYLGDIDIDKKDRTCQVVKIYEFASSEL